MAIKYNRNRVQEYLEKEIDSGYVPTSNRSIVKKFQNKAETHVLTQVECYDIEKLIKLDAYDYLYSACISFFNALENIFYKNFSWATVELYYVIYYLMRVKLHLSNVALFRANRLYYITVKAGEIIECALKNGNNTHEGTLAVFKKFFSTDLILSNTVDNMESINWIKENREIVNYKAIEFKDPDYFSYFDKFNNAELLKNNLQLIMNDYNKTFVFQPDFAMVGIPLIFFKEIINAYKLSLCDIFNEQQNMHINEKVEKLEINFIEEYLTLSHGN